MSDLYFKYSDTPRVLLADKLQTVSGVGLDRSMPLYDDNEYIVTLIACDMWEYNEGKVLKEINCSKEFKIIVKTVALLTTVNKATVCLNIEMGF